MEETETYQGLCLVLDQWRERDREWGRKTEDPRIYQTNPKL